MQHLKPQYVIYIKVTDTPLCCHEFLLNCLWNCSNCYNLSPTPPNLIYFIQLPPHTKCSLCGEVKCGCHNHEQNCLEHSPSDSILWQYILIDLFQVRPLSVGTPSVIFYFCHCQRWYFYFSILVLYFSCSRI